jgi:hypothetical protein
VNLKYYGKTIKTCVRTYWPWIISDSWYVVTRLISFQYTILLEVLFKFRASQALLKTFVYATLLYQIYNIFIFLHLGYHIGGGGWTPHPMHEFEGKWTSERKPTWLIMWVLAPLKRVMHCFGIYPICTQFNKLPCAHYNET